MPLIQIHLLEGRSKEQKKALLESVARAVQESIGARPSSIRIWLHEMPRDEYLADGVLASERKAPG